MQNTATGAFGGRSSLSRSHHLASEQCHEFGMLFPRRSNGQLQALAIHSVVVNDGPQA